MPESFETLTKWFVVMVLAWFLSWSVFAYISGEWNSLEWTSNDRLGHLVLQLGFILIYAGWRSRSLK